MSGAMGEKAIKGQYLGGLECQSGMFLNLYRCICLSLSLEIGPLHFLYPPTFP